MTVIVKIQGIQITRILIVHRAHYVGLTVVLYQRLQMSAVFPAALHLSVLAHRSGPIFMMQNVLLTKLIQTLTHTVHTTGNASNVLRQIAVWAKLACGRENVLIMGALLELLFTKPAVMRMARL